MKQIIIARKDLHMSPGKLAAQVSHASMAFLIQMIKNNTRSEAINFYSAVDEGPMGEPTLMMYKRNDLTQWASEAYSRGEEGFYAKPVDPNNPYGTLELCEPQTLHTCRMTIDNDLYENWLDEACTKVVCEAKTRTSLLKAIAIAEKLGLRENVDFFLIRDACRTELTPEDVDEHGLGSTLTCIGFRPMPDDIANKISKKFQLFH